MNRKQYSILKWMLNVGSEPKKLAKRLDLDLSDVLAVRHSDSFDSYEQMKQQGGIDELMRSLFGRAF